MMRLILLFLSLLFFGCVAFEEADIIALQNTFDLDGYVLTYSGNAVPNAKIELIGIQNYSTFSNSEGYFRFSKIEEGFYQIKISKEGFKDYHFSFNFIPGNYSLNFTLLKDCLYYSTETKRDYYIVYGYNGTLGRASLNCDLYYPNSSYLNLSYPDTKQRIKFVGDNRVVSLSIDRIHSASPIGFYILVHMNGTNTMKIFERKNTTIEQAVREMPGYLGEMYLIEQNRRRKIIDTENEEIREIAMRARNKSNNVWDVAKDLFIWLKNNTKYAREVGGDLDYVQSPSEILASRKGDCDELSYLYISLLRTAGIPSRFVEGFLVKENETRFVRHMWVEFYDGEWIPVEVAGTGTVENEVNMNFGIRRTIHVPVFIEDREMKEINKIACTYTYYGYRPEISNFIFYDSYPYDEKYLAVCGDNRFLTDAKEG
ncbi:MAG: carboxypeptidase regulatory-like domain-containing protein [Candidatus Micrarchaeota archaeon]|nr:carboxypeptidase regulatory-like domain-containing protein [Candidatus Micrarchaeota archaeon]